MKYIKLKDNFKRQLFKQSEFNLFILKSLLKNRKVKKSMRVLIGAKMLSFSNNNFKTRVVNRCIFTGRKNVLSSKYRLSRLQFPELVKQYSIQGLGRYGW